MLLDQIEDRVGLARPRHADRGGVDDGIAREGGRGCSRCSD
jgi:hypothetical protein